TSLSSVVIPDSVEVISTSAFQQCTSLVSVIIGNSVKVIDEKAFYYCTSLSSVVIPDSVETIGKDAFYILSFYDEDGNALPTVASDLSGHSYAGVGDCKLYRIAD
ncbi:MAG: leucine-rich repeat domain-containing protein, partial [Candidatus Methanomethylophilaceae archaeon]|nr:leucine-rich repeat domain-containing protein [Candidatus Methanomethylophilaceae archaeon]